MIEAASEDGSEAASEDKNEAASENIDTRQHICLAEGGTMLMPPQSRCNRDLSC